MYEGLKAAHQFGLHFVILEGDSLNVISELKNRGEDFFTIGALVKDISNIFPAFLFTSARRDGN